MRVEEVERLLSLFYEGSTTEKQEEELKEYFQIQDVPNHLQRDKNLFRNFQEDPFVEIPPGLESQLSRMIDDKEKEEMQFFRKNRAKHNWRWISSVAASVVLLLGVSYGIFSYQDAMQPHAPKDTFSNPEDAYKVLQTTLLEVSTDLNKGIDQLSETRKEIIKINIEVKDQIQSR